MKKGFFIAPASVIRRILSFLLDMIIVNILIATSFTKIIKKIIPPGSSYELLQANQNIALLTMVFVAIGIIIIFYFSYFEYHIQQTPGKILLGLKYVSEQKTASFWNYFLSNLFFLPVFPFFFLWLIDPLYMIFSAKNQTFMERLNRLMVVQKYKY